MFGSSWPPTIVSWWADFIFIVFVYSGVQHVWTWWVTWRVSCKRQKLLNLCEHLGSPPYLVGSVLLIFLVFCVVVFFLVVFIMCLVYPMLSLSLYCPFLIAPSVFYNFLLMWASFIDTENTTFTKLLLLFVSTFPYMCKNHDSSYQLIVSCLLQVQEIRPMDTTPVT